MIDETIIRTIETFESKLPKIIQWINEHNRLLSSHSSESQEKKYGKWLVEQKGKLSNNQIIELEKLLNLKNNCIK